MFSDFDDDSNVYNECVFTPPPKKKLKALSSQQKGREEKSALDMSPREEQRSTTNYDHLSFCCHRKQCHKHIAESTVRAIRDRVWRDCGQDSRRGKEKIAKA